MFRVNPFASRFDQSAWGVVARALALLLVMLACVRLLPSEPAVIDMRLDASQAGRAQWFLGSGTGFSEAESVSARLRKGVNHVRFELPPGRYVQLRFDPIAADAAVTIRSISVAPAERVLSGQLRLGALVPRSGIDTFARTRGGIRVVPVVGESDPQLQVRMDQPLVVGAKPRHLAEDLFAALVLTGLAWLLVQIVLRRLRLDQVVVPGLACALVLILAMGAVHQTSVPVHPDERLHMSGFVYYLQHFWPPAADSPAIVASLRSSPWGVSYLNSYDVVYFMAAHLMAPFSGLFDSPLAMARAFQNLLWIVLLVLALRVRAWTAGLAVLLISPQVWYVFSYFNGDAFALFLCLLAAILAGHRNGGLHRFMREGGAVPPAAFAFSLCVGLALVSKANYLPAVVGVLLWLAVCHLQARWLELIAALVMVALAIVAATAARWAGPPLAAAVPWLAAAAGAAGLIGLASLGWRYHRQRALRPTMHRLLLLLAIAAVVAAPRVVNDWVINGGFAAKAQAITAMKERYATRGFKPSVIAAGDGYAGLHPARRGMELPEMLFGPRQWLRTSARSAFGTYGYMSIWAPGPVYRAMWLVVLLLAAAAATVLLKRRDLPSGKLLLVASGSCGLVLASSVLFSWLYSFQPQGRYLLPMWPMFALALMAARPGPRQWFVTVLTVAATALSVWSYVYVGIPGIAASAS